MGVCFALFCCCSVAKSRPTPCDPVDCSTPGFPVLHSLPEFTQTHAHLVMMPSNHLILCRSLLLLWSVFPSIRVFSNESVLLIRWPKYWSFSISPSNEYLGLISFRIDWFDLIIHRTLKNLPANAGEAGSIPGLGGSPEEGNGHSSVLAWRIPWTEEPGCYCPWGCKKSETGFRS